MTVGAGALYDCCMSLVSEQVETVGASTGHAAKYTRNNPFLSTVQVNELLTGEGSEKETRHVDLSLEEGMTYTPGDAVGIVPENRESEVAEVLAALGYTGDERVLDHYKVEISLEEALRTRLGIGKLARGSVGQYAKLAPTVDYGGVAHASGVNLGAGFAFSLSEYSNIKFFAEARYHRMFTPGADASFIPVTVGIRF